MAEESKKISSTPRQEPKVTAPQSGDRRPAASNSDSKTRLLMPGAPQTNEATYSSSVYVLVGFLVVAGLIAAAYWLILKPRYQILVLKRSTAPLVSSPLPVIETKKAESYLQEPVSEDDQVEIIQEELDGITIEDFTEDLNQIKTAIDRL